MKNIISFILAGVLSVAVAMPAFAVVVQPTTEKTENADTWTTAGSNPDYAGKMMTIVAYAPATNGAITVNSIQYINQTTADKDGAYAFEKYIPKDIPASGTVYNVLVGGELLNKAIPAGTIGTAVVPNAKVAVTGKASVIGKKVTKVAAIANGVEVATANVVGSGNYTLNVDAGIYDIVITAEGYLSYKITGVPATDELLTLPDIELYAGDVIVDDNVTADDIGIVSLAYNQPTLYETVKDFDLDGSVTADDVGYASLRYKESATNVAYADFIK